MTFDASKSSCHSNLEITNSKTTSTCEKVSMCPQQGNNHGCEMLWNALLPNQDHSETPDCKENLPTPQPLTSKTSPPVPALLPTPALGNPGARTTLHLDLSSPLPPAALNAQKSQVEPMNPLCRQALVSPTAMKLLGKESQKQISCIEEKLSPRMSHRRSSGLQKAPLKDSSLVSPGMNVENAQAEAQSSTAASAISVPTGDGPNPVDPGIVLFG